MNKIFHEKITAGKVCFLFVEMALFAFFAWHRSPWLTLFFVVLVVYTIEMLLHSAYTITSDGRLLVYKGRFISKRELLLAEIDRVESGHYTFNFGLHLGSYLLVVMKNRKVIGIRPEKEEEFINYIEYKQTQLAQRQNRDEEN